MDEISGTSEEITETITETVGDMVGVLVRALGRGGLLLTDPRDADERLADLTEELHGALETIASKIPEVPKESNQ